MKVKSLIFDLDGVIVDTAKYHFAAWKLIGKEMGIDIDEEFNEKLKGVSRRDSLEIILDYGKVSLSETEKEELLVFKNDEYLKLIKTLTRADLLDGVYNLLVEAKAAQISMIIASASENARFILERVGVVDMFDGIIDPRTLKNGKPNPEIFIKAQELAGVNDDEVISLEDSQAGIQAIKAANQYAVGIGNADVLLEADVVYSSLANIGLKKIIEDFNSRNKKEKK